MTGPVRVHGGVELLGEGEIQDLTLEHVTSLPQTPNAGRVWFDDSQLRITYAEGELGDLTPSIQQIAKVSDVSQLASTVSSVTPITRTNSSIEDMVFGQPVYGTNQANSVDFAIATDSAKNVVVGLVYDTIIESTGAGRILPAGVISGTITQWQTVTGQVGGLTPNATYFLDITAGRLTITPPASQGQGVTFICPVGFALNATDFYIRIERPIHL